MTPFLPFLLIVFVLATLGCSQDSQGPSISFSGSTMGTTYRVKLVPSAPEHIPVRLQAKVEPLLAALNQQMSTYIDRSDIMHFNRMAVDQWYPVAPEFLAVITLSQEISQLTQGGFDISIGPLVELWGFGRQHGAKQQGSQAIPQQSAIEEAKSRVGWQFLLVDKERSAIKKTRPLWLDVSAIAKGYGVDQVAALLDVEGVEHYLVEIGGEMRLKGLSPRGEPWRVGIEVPSLLQQQAQQVLQLSDKAIATSGDYRNFFEEGGQRYSHTISPLTGHPVRHQIASVTVVSDSAARADALATALNVLGEDEALALAEREGLAAYFILYDNQGEANGQTGKTGQKDRHYKTFYTDRFSEFLQD